MKSPCLWFVTGSQLLYGQAALDKVAEHSRAISRALNESTLIPARVEFKPVITDPDSVRSLVLAANADPDCAGLILWMHTFSPAKMWIGGLLQTNKPLCHLHTQNLPGLPWQTIDMDFMNLNQSAHGDREAGHLHSRLGLRRKVVVGHWSHASVQESIGGWARAALAWHEWQGARIARIGDNMRFVAVTDGDKVSAEASFGFSVNGYGIGDLVAVLKEVSDHEIDLLIQEYEDLYEVSPDLAKNGPRRNSLLDAARQEIALRSFLEDGGFCGFTTTFEDLHGLNQLPGLACQRLMDQGFGFGAEGDWKTAALLRAVKVMEAGLPAGSSFMEDYTYHMEPGAEMVLGAHMLEICPTIAAGKPRLEIHPLGIGGKSDPVRLVFEGRAGQATNTTLIDLGHRFRFIVQDVQAVEPRDMPKLPVARALWKVEPNFEDGLAAWIYAGGAHHTAYSLNIGSSHICDLAEIAGVECLVIDKDTKLRDFRNEIRWNEGAYRGRG
jgi:L-arabinose isomerase